MAILDTNYEENNYVAEHPTLSFDITGNPIPYTYTETVGKLISNQYQDIPSYVAIENSIKMNVPTIGSHDISPFETLMPKVNTMFGVHVINKPLGFYQLNIINSVSNFPYFRENNGETYSSDGVVSGYVMNGINAELTIASLDDTEVRLATINDDVYTNPRTLRLIYDDNGQYGAYQLIDIYINMPTKVDESGVGTVYSYEIVKTDSCLFYNRTETSDGVYEYNIIPIDEANSESWVYVEYISSSARGHKYLKLRDIPNERNKKETYDPFSGDLVFWNSAGADAKSIDVTSYQYLLINPNNYTLSVSDGYGDDCEIGLDLTLQTPTNITLTIPDSYYSGGSSSNLRLSVDYSSEVESTDMTFKLKCFNVANENHVNVHEEYWNELDTDVTTQNGKIFGYIEPLGSGHYGGIYTGQMNSQMNIYTHKISDTKTLIATVLTYKIPAVSYSVISNNMNTCVVQNLFTHATNSGHVGDARYLYSVLGGYINQTDISNVKYTIKVEANGDAIVTLYNNNSTTNYIIYQNNTYKFNLTTFHFNKKEERIITRNMSSVNGRYLVQVYDKTVAVEGPTDIGIHSMYIYDGLYRVLVNYRFSDFTLVSSENMLEYPDYNTNKILGLFKSAVTYSNQLTDKSIVGGILPQTTSNFIVSPDVTSLFLVGRYIGEDCTYITYSPKLDVTIPLLKVYGTKNDTTSKVAVTGQNLWNDSDKTSWYLRNYDFIITHIKLDEDGNTVEYQYSSNTVSFMEIKDSSGTFVCNGYSFDLVEIVEDTDRWSITDMTGLTITNLRHQNTSSNSNS